MTRDHDALLAAIDGRMRAPFAWDDTGIDCVRFAAEAVTAQTGQDPLAALGVSWTTARGARRALTKQGGLSAAVDQVLKPIAGALAQRGDIALVETATGPALMVIEGDTLIGPGATGLIRLPRSAMTRAWSAQ